MPDQDLLLDALVADVSSQTRAPGASAAIDTAHRRRTAVTAAGAVGAVAVFAAGGALVAGTLGGSDGTSSLAGPVTTSPEPPAGQEGTDAYRTYRTLQAALASVPGWAIADAGVADPSSMRACAADWSDGAGGSFGSVPLTTSGDGPSGWASELHFQSAEQASDAVDRLIGKLTSCTAESWRSQPVAQTGTVLAVSDTDVIWVHRQGASVSTLQVASTDGPPPLDVQVAVADVVSAWVG